MRTIGEGASGAVHLVEEIDRPGVRWALKEHELSNLGIEELGEAGSLYLREISILESLNHPGIPKLVESFTSGSSKYILMEYIDGETLDEIMQKKGHPFTAEQLIPLLLQIARILDYLHNQQPFPIIFRDIKPSNIILTTGGKIKLIDFGIARFFRPGRTKDTQQLGTPGFSAPEQYGSGQSDTRSDIFSLGATIYHLLTGMDMLHLNFNYQTISALAPRGLPLWLEHLVMKCLSYKPDDRYQSARDLIRNIEFERSDYEGYRPVTPESLKKAIQIFQQRMTPNIYRLPVSPTIIPVYLSLLLSSAVVFHYNYNVNHLIMCLKTFFLSIGIAALIEYPFDPRGIIWPLCLFLAGIFIPALWVHDDANETGLSPGRVFLWTAGTVISPLIVFPLYILFHYPGSKLQSLSCRIPACTNRLSMPAGSLAQWIMRATMIALAVASMIFFHSRRSEYALMLILLYVPTILVILEEQRRRDILKGMKSAASLLKKWYLWTLPVAAVSLFEYYRCIIRLRSDDDSFFQLTSHRVTFYCGSSSDIILILLNFSLLLLLLVVSPALLTYTHRIRNYSKTPPTLWSEWHIWCAFLLMLASSLTGISCYTIAFFPFLVFLCIVFYSLVIPIKKSWLYAPDYAPGTSTQQSRFIGTLSGCMLMLSLALVCFDLFRYSSLVVPLLSLSGFLYSFSEHPGYDHRGVPRWLFYADLMKISFEFIWIIVLFRFIATSIHQIFFLPYH